MDQASPPEATASSNPLLARQTPRDASRPPPWLASGSRRSARVAGSRPAAWQTPGCPPVIRNRVHQCSASMDQHGRLLSEPVDIFRGRGHDRIERLALGFLAAELREGDLGQGVGLSQNQKQYFANSQHGVIAPAGLLKLRPELLLRRVHDREAEVLDGHLVINIHLCSLLQEPLDVFKQAEICCVVQQHLLLLKECVGSG